MNMLHKPAHTGELLTLIGEAYQVIGILAHECERFDDPQVIKMMDNLVAGKMVHSDVLPFPSKPDNPPLNVGSGED